MPLSHFGLITDRNPIIGIAKPNVWEANLIFRVWGPIGIFHLFRNIWGNLWITLNEIATHVQRHNHFGTGQALCEIGNSPPSRKRLRYRFLHFAANNTHSSIYYDPDTRLPSCPGKVLASRRQQEFSASSSDLLDYFGQEQGLTNKLQLRKDAD